MICFGLLFMRLSPSYDFDYEFGRLTLVDSSYFLFFLIDFFLILSFNIEFIEN